MTVPSRSRKIVHPSAAGAVNFPIVRATAPDEA
jgi:hypothetical protein